MKAIHVLYALLLAFLTGCATTSTKPTPPEVANLSLPVTNKAAVFSCYYKQPTVFSSSTPASKEEFSEFIQKEVGTFVSELGKGMTDAGFTDVSMRPLSAGSCSIVKNETSDINIAVKFVMIHQKFGLSEDVILADTFIKVPGKDLMVAVGRKTINGGISNVEAKAAAAEIAPLLVQKVRDAQKRVAIPAEAAIGH